MIYKTQGTEYPLIKIGGLHGMDKEAFKRNNYIRYIDNLRDIVSYYKTYSGGV